MDSAVRYVRICLGCHDREEYILHWTRRLRRDPNLSYKEEECLCPPCRWKIRNFPWCEHCQEVVDEPMRETETVQEPHELEGGDWMAVCGELEGSEDEYETGPEEASPQKEAPDSEA